MFGYTVDVNILLVLVIGLVNVLALMQAVRLHREVKDAASAIHRCAVHQRELAQLLETHNQLADIQNLTELVVENGATTIRSLHREIANIPFEILEHLPTTSDSSRLIRGAHDLTADSVYSSITTLNKLMGRRLRRQFRLDSGKFPDHGDNDDQESS